MFKKIVPVTQEKFQNLKIKPVDSYEFAQGSHLSSIMLNEFTKAASVYPIVFIEDKAEKNDNPEFRPVVLLGLKEKENCFITSDGNWDAPYIPAIIRRYPFVLAKTKEDGTFAVCIDEESHLLSEDEGEELILENGDAAPLLERVKGYLGQLHQMSEITSQFCRLLKDKYLLAPIKMHVRDDDTIKNIAGTYAVDNQRLNDMSDKDFLDLRKKNFLAPIYSHITSIAQIDRLVTLQKKKN